MTQSSIKNIAKLHITSLFSITYDAKLRNKINRRTDSTDDLCIDKLENFRKFIAPLHGSA